MAATSFTAQVKKVDKESCTCTVAMDNISYDEVLIRAVSGGDKGVILIPKTDSKVMVTRIGGSNELYVSMVSEVQEVIVNVGDKTALTINENGVTTKVGNTAFEIAENGVSIANTKNNLKAVLEELITAISAITVPCSAPGSASGPPANASAITAIKGKLDFLK